MKVPGTILLQGGQLGHRRRLEEGAGTILLQGGQLGHRRRLEGGAGTILLQGDTDGVWKGVQGQFCYRGDS